MARRQGSDTERDITPRNILVNPIWRDDPSYGSCGESVEGVRVHGDDERTAIPIVRMTKRELIELLKMHPVKVFGPNGEMISLHRLVKSLEPSNEAFVFREYSTTCSWGYGTFSFGIHILYVWRERAEVYMAYRQLSKTVIRDYRQYCGWGFGLTFVTLGATSAMCVDADKSAAFTLARRNEAVEGILDEWQDRYINWLDNDRVQVNLKVDKNAPVIITPKPQPIYPHIGPGNNGSDRHVGIVSLLLGDWSGSISGKMWLWLSVILLVVASMVPGQVVWPNSR